MFDIGKLNLLLYSVALFHILRSSEWLKDETLKGFV